MRFTINHFGKISWSRDVQSALGHPYYVTLFLNKENEQLVVEYSDKSRCNVNKSGHQYYVSAKRELRAMGILPLWSTQCHVIVENSVVLADVSGLIAELPKLVLAPGVYVQRLEDNRCYLFVERKEAIEVSNEFFEAFTREFFEK
jgi:hypothetical protein